METNELIERKLTSLGYITKDKWDYKIESGDITVFKNGQFLTKGDEAAIINTLKAQFNYALMRH